MNLANDITRIEFEFWLDDRYHEGITLGATTAAQRISSVRAVLGRDGRADEIVNGKTLRQAFERVYGEPLDPVQHHENNDGV